MFRISRFALHVAQIVDRVSRYRFSLSVFVLKVAACIFRTSVFACRSGRAAALVGDSACWRGPSLNAYGGAYRPLDFVL